MKTKNENRGRKKLPESAKKQKVAIYITGEQIRANGGLEKVKAKMTAAVTNN